MLFAYRALLAAFAVLSQSGALKPEPAFKAISQMSGSNTAIEASRAQAITDDGAWTQLWKEHHSSFQIGVKANGQDDAPDRPTIDFNADAVLCLFGGQSKNVGGFDVVDSGSDAKTAYIRLEPQLLPDTGTTILQNPFIFIIVPKTKRTITVQLDRTPLGGHGWSTLATFGPTKN